VLGEVVGADEGQDVCLQRLEVRVVEGLGGGVLDGAVHPPGLTVGPGMVGSGQAVLDAVFVADPIEDVPGEVPAGRGIRREGGAVAGQHGVDLVGEGLDHSAQERGAVQLRVGVEEGDVGELGDPVDGQGHVEPAPGEAQLADVDADVADRGIGEATALGGLLVVAGQAGDAVAREAAVKRGATEAWDGFTQAAQDIIERQEGSPSGLDDDRLLGFGQGAAAGPRWPHRRVEGGGPPAPLGDGLGVQPVAGGQGAGALFRRLELGSNTRRRPG
jgi:hypothetical protein